MHANYKQRLGSLALLFSARATCKTLQPAYPGNTHTKVGGEQAEVNWALGVCAADFGVGNGHKVSTRGGSMGVGLRMNLAEICSYRVCIGDQEI